MPVGFLNRASNQRVLARVTSAIDQTMGPTDLYKTPWCPILTVLCLLKIPQAIRWSCPLSTCPPVHLPYHLPTCQHVDQAVRRMLTAVRRPCAVTSRPVAPARLLAVTRRRIAVTPTPAVRRGRPVLRRSLSAVTRRRTAVTRRSAVRIRNVPKP